MNKIMKWYLHRKWIKRQILAWQMACRNHYEWEEEPIEHWVKESLRYLKKKIITIMKIVRFDKEGNCQFIWFNWRRFRFETTCWANSLSGLLGKTKDKKHLIIGLWNR